MIKTRADVLNRKITHKKVDMQGAEVADTIRDVHFEIGWATSAEKQWLDREMFKLSRQRMNLHVMKDALFILLKTEHGEIIGWGGLDVRYNPKFPELFSLNLDPRFRKYSLGLLLESARVTYLTSQNVEFAYVRMTRDSAYRQLMQRRLESRFYTVIDPAQLESDYVGLCRRCELFGGKCLEQVYLKFDVKGFYEQSVHEMGEIDIANFPKSFELRRTRIQLADELQMRKYLPNWI